MRYLVPIGRLFFSLIFILSAPGHFKQGTIEFAAKAGVPYAHLLVPASGVVALLGALSVFLGFKAKLGAWLIVLFLVPVTLTMHRFWGISDQQVAMMQHINFMKNTAMLGGAIMIAYFGAGPISVDEWLEKRNAPPPR
jgi:putative oxidoreductase